MKCRLLLAMLFPLIAGFGSLCVAQEGKQSKRPNVVLILADDLGIGDVSAFQSNHIATPNIDQLGRSGIRFTDAHVSAAVCMPSRAGLMTGRQGTRHGSEFNAGPGLNANETTIAELVKTAGYKTGAIGKWHLGTTEGRDPLSQGFDEFFGLSGGGTTYIDPKDPRAINGYGVSSYTSSTEKPVTRDLSRGRNAIEEPEYLTDAFTREAVDFIGRHKSDPFFLYVAFNAPHSPHQTIDKYYDRFPEIENHNSRVYAAMVSAVDDGVGSIVRKLEEEKLTQNTIVIFLSDNGGPDYFPGGPSNAEYAGWKRYHLEGGHRTPLFVSWPGTLASGKVESRLTSSLDIFPTIASVTGAALSKERPVDGVDLIPFLQGKRDNAPHTSLFWRAGANFAAREGKWKLVVINKTTQEELAQFENETPKGLLPNGPFNEVSPLGQLVALYDLEADPSESKNLASQNPSIVTSLRNKFEEWNKSNVPPNAKSSRGIPTVIDGTPVQLAF